MNGSGPQSAGLALVGVRATGKSSVGRRLAEALGRPFADTDCEIIRRAGGLAISEIFKRHGEPYFRALETEALEALTAVPGQILATGGGIVLAETNRARLKRYGFVVWLTAAPEVLAARLAADPEALRDRPALTPAGALAEVAAVLQARTPIYQALADATVDTTTMSIDLAAAIVRVLWQAAAPGPTPGAGA